MYRSAKVRLILSVIIMGLLLAGCGTNDGNATATKQSMTAENTATESTKTESVTDEVASKTKLYTDAIGREVEIPTNPQRVVALWTVGEMLALDTKPIGSTTHLLRFFNDEEKENIEIVGNTVAGDYEKILSLNPDLIIVYALVSEEELEQYSKIAPTVATQFFGEAMDSLRDLGEILNKQDIAENWIANYHARVEAAREEVKDLNLQDEKAVVLQLAQKSIYLYRSSTFPTIFDAYQFQLSSYQDQLEEPGDFAQIQLSMELLPEFSDVDRIFITISDDDSKVIYDSFAESSIWNSLPAVQANQVYLIDNRLSIADVSTLDWALDEVKGLLK